MSDKHTVYDAIKHIEDEHKSKKSKGKSLAKKIVKEKYDEIVNTIGSKSYEDRVSTSAYIDGVSRVLETALEAKVRLGKKAISMTVEDNEISICFPNGVEVENRALSVFFEEFFVPCYARGMGRFDGPMKYDSRICGNKVIIKFKFKD